ncbi:hypothetical protein H5410_021798 [Solanum commersonii]|uniref:CCHC-type domain-containing protein n=1 Tax=Solanum commersonii TaxID=4109 RepID=A0A9J5ZDJ4_SOLCO|nr:hypothetical protein H5410_021798 [Solanum commersonii]
MQEKDFTLSIREITKSVFPPQQSFQINKNDRIKGKEKVVHRSFQPPPDIDDFKIKDYSDVEDFLAKKFKGGGLQHINAKNFSEEEPSHKNEFSDDINKVSENYARKPVQRIQIYTIIHRMLMYNTICKTNKNNDKTIANMITAGFIGQLKGWWDNYLNQDQRDKIHQAIKQEGEQWSDNSETIRTLLQNLRCKTLTSFRYYKDVFLYRFMELPECNSTHWKSKFIDGLHALFAERVRKSLRGDNTSINYEEYTYGKLISVCIQKGLSLCNEIKLNQQIKRHRLNERQQLGEFCEQSAFDIPKQKSKDKEYTPKKKKSSIKDYEKWKNKRIEKKLRRAEEGKGDSSKRKKKYQHNYKKSNTCHKCGRFGHYAKDCRVKEKI